MPPDLKYNEMSKTHPLYLHLYLLSELCHNTFFFPIIDNASSVVRLMVRDQSTSILSSAPTTERKMSSAVMVWDMGTNSRNSSVAVNVSSTPQINVANWETSAISVLINCDRKCEKWLRFALEFVDQICRYFRNPVCHGISHPAIIGKSLLLLRTHNLASLQHARILPHSKLWC